MEAHMTQQFDVVVERDSEGFFVASVPALPGCHTQARSLDELMSRVREAIELCLEEQGGPVTSLDFVGVQRVTVNA
jgi:predicted RNase H-like HicB family nuclease